MSPGTCRHSQFGLSFLALLALPRTARGEHTCIYVPFWASTCVLFVFVGFRTPGRSPLRWAASLDTGHSFVQLQLFCYTCTFGPNSKCQMHSLSLLALEHQLEVLSSLPGSGARGTTWNKVKIANPRCVWQAHALLGIVYCHSDTEPQCRQPKLRDI